MEMKEKFQRRIRALHNSLDFSLQEEFSSRWMTAIWRTPTTFYSLASRCICSFSPVIRDYRPRNKEIERRRRRKRKMCDREFELIQRYMDNYNRKESNLSMNEWKLKIENIKFLLFKDKSDRSVRMKFVDKFNFTLFFPYLWYL